MTQSRSDSILRKILEDAHMAQLNGERCLAVFDLDSTLFDLTPRIQEILNAFATNVARQTQFPEACQRLLSHVRIASTDWGLHESLHRAGLFEADHPAFYRELHEHWAFCFFSNRYLHQDQPLPGAVEFVLALEAENARIMYLTGRDTHRMRQGTEASLRAWNFPLDREHVELVLKPHAAMDDAQFKLEVLRRAAQSYDRIWFFENEPVNLNLVRKHIPDIHLVFIETTHSGREQVAAELARIPHFEVDLGAFREFKAAAENADR